MFKRPVILLLSASILFLFSCKKDQVSTDSLEQRYADEMFISVSKNTVVYSDTFNFEMDIYSPDADTETDRPVVILAHGGGFFTGSKENPAMVRMAQNLAKRGYVAASINYHLASGFAEMLDSTRAAALVSRAIGDGRAAVGYMRKAEANGDPYGIDPNKIFFGGNSAGAIIALHVGFLDMQDPLETHLDSIINANGGFEGFSGNDGFASNVSAVLNLAGGITSLKFIDANDVPVINFHGVDDDVVPANCGDVFAGATGGLDVIDVCDSIPIHNTVVNVGGASILNTYPGKHVPWMDADGMPLPLFDEVEQKCFDFLYQNL